MVDCASIVEGMPLEPAETDNLKYLANKLHKNRIKKSRRRQKRKAMAPEQQPLLKQKLPIQRAIAQTVS